MRLTMSHNGLCLNAFELISVMYWFSALMYLSLARLHNEICATLVINFLIQACNIDIEFAHY